ncbi:VOC family protein [Nocardia sp. BMG111209]|uniref:VOC family protein n=1 Tax=Nocardia sp. BMG111209 TaxID=1160137 RepID=UPI000381762A|nr:VOC family protein [Nocardia sp. BMG111209]
MTAGPLLDRIGLPGDESAWTALGFDLAAGGFALGAVTCTVGAEPAWGFDVVHADPAVLGIPVPDRIPTASTPPGIDPPASHPNHSSYVDHLVYWVPDLDDAVTALNAVLGTEPRRRFHPRGPSSPEMAFYRVGKPFLEVVSSGRPPILAGIAFGTTDLDATVAAVRAAGGPIGDPKPAVQGGRIASVWHGHLEWGIAFLEPKPR